MNTSNAASRFPIRHTLLWWAWASALAPACLAIASLIHWRFFEMPAVEQPALEVLAALPMTAVYLLPAVLLFALPYLGIFGGAVWVLRSTPRLRENAGYAGMTSLAMALPSAIAIAAQANLTYGAITWFGTSVAIFVPRVVVRKLAPGAFQP